MNVRMLNKQQKENKKTLHFFLLLSIIYAHKHFPKGSFVLLNCWKTLTLSSLRKSSPLGKKKIRIIDAPFGTDRMRASEGPHKYHSVLLGWAQDGGKLARQKEGPNNDNYRTDDNPNPKQLC